MDLLTGKLAAERIEGLINPKFQVQRFAVDLSVKAIYVIDPVGQVDFGGSEYKPAGKVKVASIRRNREDRYEWWDLGRGCYFVEFNESLALADDEFAVVEPDERLLRAGATHGTMFLRGRVAPLEVLMEVDIVRLQMKQNARISRVRVFKFLSKPGAAAPAPAAPAATKAPAKKTAKKRGK
jgi:deoxycytidine triphosphate deaminase